MTLGRSDRDQFGEESYFDALCRASSTGQELTQDYIVAFYHYNETSDTVALIK